jgi:hypothetical protein
MEIWVIWEEQNLFLTVLEMGSPQPGGTGLLDTSSQVRRHRFIGAPKPDHVRGALRT